MRARRAADQEIQARMHEILRTTRRDDGLAALLDLHSAAAYENVMILKQVIESEGVMAKPDTLQEDRNKIRAGLAKLQQTTGLLGITKRTPDREAIKPFLFVHAKAGKWEVLHNPLN